MGWLNWFTSAGRMAARESATAAKAMYKSSAELAAEATRVAAQDAAAAERLTAAATKTAEAAKEATKAAAEGTKSTLSAADRYAKSKMYALYGVGGYVAYNKVVNGKGALSSGAGILLDDPKEGEGYVSNMWRQLVGDRAADKSLIGAGVDTVFGDGTYDGSVSLLHRGGEEVSGMYHGISDALQGFIMRHGTPTPYPESPYYDPSYYDVSVNPQNYAGLTGDRAFMQQYALSGMGSGLFNRMNALTGMNNINAFNLGELALAAFLTFGPFGKLAKVGGLLLGANGYRNMNKENGVVRQQQARQQGYYPGVDIIPDVARGQGSYQADPSTAYPQEDEPYVVHRGRGI